jgi:hypothetical protein
LDPDIHPADPAERQRLIKWLVVIAICGGLLILMAEPVAERVAGWAANDPGRYAARAGLVLAAIGLTTALPLSGLVIYLFNLAREIESAGRYPPPGRAVAIDTRILVGPSALGRARMIRFLSLALVVGMIAEIYLLWQIWHLLAIAGATAALA